MAINPTYTHGKVLSKVKIGEQVYYLKDLDLRAIVDAFGNATAQDVATVIAENGTGLTTSAQVYTFVTDAVKDLEGAMHFIGVKDALPATGEAGDVVIVGTKEYVYGTDGKWTEIGDEGLWVPNTRTLAGIDLKDDITAAELKSALSLKALAFVDTATTTLDDYVTGLTGAAYTPEGSVSVESSESDANATITNDKYTPTGSVGVSKKSGAAVSYQNVTGVTVASKTAGDGDTANYTPAGEVTITNVTVTPSTGTASHVTNSGTAYTITAGNAVKANDTKSQFATEGITADIDDDDSEMLVFSTASKADAVTAAGDVTYTAPTLSGALPTFENVSVSTGIQSASATASFAGKGAVISAEATKSAADATVTDAVYEAEFTGTEVADLKIKSISYKKTTVGDASFTGTATTITPTLTKGDKVITVGVAPASNG